MELRQEDMIFQSNRIFTEPRSLTQRNQRHVDCEMRQVPPATTGMGQ